MKSKGIEILRNTTIWILASASLGLAPFVPEPHVWGKLKWIMGGAGGMKIMDWMDFLWHGFPFVFLTISLVLKLKKSEIK